MTKTWTLTECVVCAAHGHDGETEFATCAACYPEWHKKRTTETGALVAEWRAKGWKVA